MALALSIRWSLRRCAFSTSLPIEPFHISSHGCSISAYTDTLCGTKVLTRKNYLKIQQGRDYFGDFDPFGDFDLIFGAAKLNLKIVEVPIRYAAREYGETQISRFRHGFLLLRMVLFAYRKLKII